MMSKGLYESFTEVGAHCMRSVTDERWYVHLKTPVLKSLNLRHTKALK